MAHIVVVRFMLFGRASEREHEKSGQKHTTIGIVIQLYFEARIIVCRGFE